MSDATVMVNGIPRYADEVDAWPDQGIEGWDMVRIINYLHRLACDIASGDSSMYVMDVDFGMVDYTDNSGDRHTESTGKIRLSIQYTNHKMHNVAVGKLSDANHRPCGGERLPPPVDDREYHERTANRMAAQTTDSYSVLDDVSRLLSGDSEKG